MCCISEVVSGKSLIHGQHDGEVSLPFPVQYGVNWQAEDYQKAVKGELGESCSQALIV